MIRRAAVVAALIVSLTTGAGANAPTVLRVGKGKPYAKPSQAAPALKDGMVVEIDAGVYEKDVAVWDARSYTIRGVGGRTHLKSGGAAADSKGIWVLRGTNVTIENVEFSGCAVPDFNGAGIRFEGQNLTLRNCFFHDNEMGILSGHADGEILVEHSEFARNGHGDGQSHNIYIGQCKSFTLRFSYSHHAIVGHNVKSRARANYILYNRIGDEEEGTSSYDLDLPEGGASYVVGNLIHKGPKAQNRVLLAYGMEGRKNDRQELYVVNNTFVTDQGGSTFIALRGTPNPVKVMNNIFLGPGGVLSGKGEASHNLAGQDALLALGERYDYRLLKGSPAIDAGAPPGKAGDFDLTPKFHYVHPCRKEARPILKSLDLGAYEFTGTGPQTIRPGKGGKQ